MPIYSVTRSCSVCDECFDGGNEPIQDEYGNATFATFKEAYDLGWEKTMDVYCWSFAITVVNSRGARVIYQDEADKIHKKLRRMKQSECL